MLCILVLGCFYFILFFILFCNLRSCTNIHIVGFHSILLDCNPSPSCYFQLLFVILQKYTVWTHVIADSMQHNTSSVMQTLLYPLIQVCLGAVSLLQTPRYSVQVDLCTKAGVFIMHLDIFFWGGDFVL